MGYFSFITSDTHESVSNCDSTRGALPVYLLQPDGEPIFEELYEGYGVFGGNDVYALVARWNVPEQCNGDDDHDRHIGIDIACYDEDNAKLKYPIKIVRNPAPYDEVEASKSCPNQGYFYEEDEWEYEEDEWEEE